MIIIIVAVVILIFIFINNYYIYIINFMNIIKKISIKYFYFHFYINNFYTIKLPIKMYDNNNIKYHYL